MQLVHPEFLWGLLAIGIPVAIHLLQLRRPQRILFTNTGFIREVELTTMRRRRLQEVLVLLTRVLAIVALVLLFCQPFIPQASMSAQPTGNAVSVLVDNSSSMQVAGQVQRLQQEAQDGASALGKSYGPSAHFKLLGRPGGSLTQAAYQATLASQSIDRKPIGWGSAVARDALQDGKQDPLYVFSDFQKNELNPQVLQSIQRAGEVVLVPQVARQVGNVYVDSVWLNDAFVRARTNLGLHIRLRNGGIEEVTNCPVKVLIGAQQVATFQVSVGVGQATDMVAQIQLPNATLALGKVVTGDASVTFDNTYYFTLQPAAAVRVLEIGNEPITQQAYAREPLFTYSFARPQLVNYSELRQANLVLLREVAQIDVGLRKALIGVVHHGGSVVIVPPASTAAHSSYHELFRALGIGGEQWEVPSATAPVKEEVMMPNARNPFFKDVFGAQPRQVVMPQVAPVLHLGQGGTDIMRLRDGSAYLTEFGSEAGQTYVFTAPFANEYTDFTSHSLFVPVLYRLAMLSYHTSQPLAYRLNNPALEVAVPSSAGRTTDEASYRLVHDSLSYIPSQRVQAGQLHMDMPASIVLPGFYQLVKQGRVLTTLAINMDKRESELAAYSAAELRQLIGPNQPNVRVLEGGAQPETLARYRAEQTGQPLWRYCLLLALVCLLAEALLLRFGRQRNPAALVAA
jgi:hypothetical protein